MRRSVIGIAVATCAFLFSSAPASAHHDMVCTTAAGQLSTPICVAGYRHEIENILADPPRELRRKLGIFTYVAGHVPDEVCNPALPPTYSDDLCVTGLGANARYYAEETENALEPVICTLATAGGWRCDW